MTKNVYAAALAETPVPLPGDERVEVLTIDDLQAGQYVISGTVLAANHDTDSGTWVVCYIDVKDSPHDKGRPYGVSQTRLQPSGGGGITDSRSVPLAAQFTVSTGPGELRVECQRHGRRGSPVILGGYGRMTQVIATRVGDAPR